jgi:hypothetical protein
MSNIYNISVTFDVITEESAEIGETEEAGFEREDEDLSLDELRKLIHDYGFSSPSCSSITNPMSFSTTEPREDRAFFENGESRYFALHLNSVNGEAPTLEDFADIARIAKIRVNGLDRVGTRLPDKVD